MGLPIKIVAVAAAIVNAGMLALGGLFLLMFPFFFDDPNPNRSPWRDISYLLAATVAAGFGLFQSIRAFRGYSPISLAVALTVPTGLYLLAREFIG
jgi:hypothetical protein